MTSALESLQTAWNRSWYWLVPLLFSLIYEGRGIASVGMWIDEFYTARAVMGGFGEANGEPPYLPYYTFAWALTGGGSCTTEFCLRLPSALAMMGAVVLVAVTGRLVAGRRAGLAAGLFVAISPATQRFAHDARPFALAALLLSAATLALVLARRSERRGIWVIYGALVALMGIVLPTALAVLPGHAVLLWRKPFPRTIARRWIISLAATIPVFLTVGYLLLSAPSWRGHGDVFTVDYTNAWTSWYSMNSGGLASNPGVGELAMAVFILGIISRQGTRWTAAAAVSAAGVWLASFGPYSWFMGRFFFPFLGLAAIGAGVGLSRLSPRRMGVILLAVIVALLPAYTANRVPWARGYDFRAAAKVISENWREGDLIVHANDGNVGAALNYYLPDEVTFKRSASAEPARRYWVFNEGIACTPDEQWEFELGNSLTLCPAGVETPG